MDVHEVEEILKKERENPSFALSLSVVDEAVKSKLLSKEDEKLFTQCPHGKCDFLDIFWNLSKNGVLLLMHAINLNAKAVIDGSKIMFRMGNDSVSIDQRDFTTRLKFSCNLRGHVVVESYEDLRARVENLYNCVSRHSAIEEMLIRFDLVGMASENSPSVQWCFDNLHFYVDDIKTPEDLLLAILNRQKRLSYTKTFLY